MKKIILKIKNIINKFLFIFGYRISKVNNTGELVKIYKYESYEEYKKTQIYFNKKKIEKIWADEINLKIVSDFLKSNIEISKIQGLCHGSRNGFEQNFFNKELKHSKVIGTDISDTAANYENSVVHDFHEEKKEWINKFDFIYTNSLDQSYNPQKALRIWLNQIKKDRFLIIEHSDQHGVMSSGKMDPFGVEANFFPYLLSEWFGHSVSIQILKSIKPNKNNAPVILFIIKKNF